MLLIWQRTRMMTLRKPLLSVYRRHRYTNFKWAISVEKSWNVVFHFKSLHRALFWHGKRNTYSLLFVKTGAIKIIQLYLHVLPAFISDCLCKMPKFPGQSLILVVGASCKWLQPRLMVTTHVLIFMLFEECATYLGAVLFNISVPWCDTNSVGGGGGGQGGGEGGT